MRFRSPFPFGAITVLALSLTTACGGGDNTSDAAKEQRIGTKIDKNGNTIFDGKSEKKETNSTSRRRTRIDTNPEVAADGALEVDGDGAAELTETDTPVEGAEDTVNPTEDAAAQAAKEEEEKRLADEAAAKEAEAKAKLEAEKAAAAKADAARNKADAAKERRRKAAAARKAKERRRAMAQKRKEEEKARKAKEKEEAGMAAVAKTEAELAAEAARLKEEEARILQEAADARAAANAIRRLQAEAAAKEERERQAREMARIGEGVNKECPYVSLETVAATGELTTANINCLESSLDKASMGMDRANISMVLITNAHAKGDVEEWEKYIENHLTSVERENPALAYRYALHLFEKGPGESQATFRWTGVALKSRSAWAGEAYTERVNSIYKLRAAAAQSLWRQSIEALDSFPGEENENRVKTQRYLARNVAKEWYEFAASHEHDPTMAYQLCNIASLDEAFCQLPDEGDEGDLNR